jgi:hypothetical protein
MATKRGASYGSLATPLAPPNPAIEHDKLPPPLPITTLSIITGRGTSRRYRGIAALAVVLVILVCGLVGMSRKVRSSMDSEDLVSKETKSTSVCKETNFRSQTLKLAYEKSIIAMLGDNKGQKVFEASDVIQGE